MHTHLSSLLRIHNKRHRKATRHQSTITKADMPPVAMTYSKPAGVGVTKTVKENIYNFYFLFGGKFRCDHVLEIRHCRSDEN